MKRLMLLPVVFAAGLIVLPIGKANADDVRPCVSTVEANGYHHQQTKSDLEKRWEVKGLGEVYVIPGFGDVTLYPRCGEVKRYPDRFYGLVYKYRDGVWWGVVLVWSSGKA